MNPAPRPLQGGFFNGYFFLEFRCRDFQKELLLTKTLYITYLICITAKIPNIVYEDFFHN